jgi:hypothetical protein
MNEYTGEIKEFSPEVEIAEPFVPIEKSDMTKRQRKDMLVSKFDNKSKLGKMYTSLRIAHRTRNK